MNIEIETKFDDGDALAQDVRVDGKLIGHIWIDGEGCPAMARAVSNVAGYWAKDVTQFETLAGALYCLCHQAHSEKNGR